MTPDELARILSLGSRRACVVDLRILQEASGFVRTTTLHEGNRVCIAFDTWGMDEGGLYFWAAFPTQDAMISCIEFFLGRPMSQWPLNAEYPQPLPAQTSGTDQFIDLLRSGRLPLPTCGVFEAKGSSYWLQNSGEGPAL
jgi:hypothetical protein